MDGFDIKFLILVCADRDARAVSHVADDDFTFDDDDFGILDVDDGDDVPGD